MDNRTYIPGTGEGGGALLLSPFSSYIGSYYQSLYNYTNNTVFYNMSDYHMRPFYRTVQNWERWYNGFVPVFHNFSDGVVPTGLAKAIVDKVAGIIYGGGVIFDSAGSADGSSNAMQYISAEWSQDVGFRAKLQDAIRMMCALGTSALKLNADENNNLWLDAVPINRSFYNMDARGDIVNALFYLRPYTVSKSGQGGDDTAFVLVEERYTGDDGAPMCCYHVRRSSTAENVFTEGTGNIGWTELPRQIRDALRKDYGGIRIDEPIRIPLTDIGVYLLRFTPSCARMPHLKYGDSVLEGIIEYLCDYDILSAIIKTEMYAGRARIVAPKRMQGPTADGINYNSGFDSFMFTEYSTTDTKDPGVTIMQPDIRSEQLKSLRNTLLEDICSAIGISPSSFASYLDDNSNRTAREISAEESATTLFAENHRDLILCPINNMLDAVARYKGFSDTVRMRFSKSGQTNYTLLVENVTRMYQAGLMSLDKAVKEVNPGMDEEQVREEIKRIEAEQKAKQDARAGIFGSMDFSPDGEPG